jgi:hypothetical protein
MPDAVRTRCQHPEVGSRHKIDLDAHAFDSASCHMIHLARTVARTAWPCAACTRTPSSSPSHTTSVQYSIVSGRRPFLMAGAGPMDVPAPLSTMHRRLGLLSGNPVAVATSSRSALITPPVNPVKSVSLVC